MEVLPPFEYLEPQTVKEAVHALSAHSGKAEVLAGGIDLVPRLRQHKIEPEFLISLHQIPGLNYIVDAGAQGLRIGALTRLREVELSPLIQKDYLVLYEAVHHIASVQVKTMGTLVGNLCVATPASDVALALFALEASLHIFGPGGEKTVLLQDFCVGVKQSCLRSDEIVTEVSVPRLSGKAGEAFLKLARAASDVAKINVAVVLTLAGDSCQEVRIALGAVAPTPVRVSKAEEILRGQEPEPGIINAAAEAAAQVIRPITDIRSTAEYRKEVTRVLVRRTIEEAVARARAQ